MSAHKVVRPARRTCCEPATLPRFGELGDLLECETCGKRWNRRDIGGAMFSVGGVWVPLRWWQLNAHRLLDERGAS